MPLTYARASKHSCVSLGERMALDAFAGLTLKVLSQFL